MTLAILTFSLGLLLGTIIGICAGAVLAFYGVLKDV